MMEALNDIECDFVGCMLDEGWRAKVLKNVSSVMTISSNCRDILRVLLSDLSLWEIPYRHLGDAYDREWLRLVDDWREQVFARSKMCWSYETNVESPRAVQVLQYLFTFEEVWVGPRVDMDIFYASLDFEEWFDRMEYWDWSKRVLDVDRSKVDITVKDPMVALDYVLSMYTLWCIPCQYQRSHAWFERYRRWKRYIMKHVDPKRFKGCQHGSEIFEMVVKDKMLMLASTRF